MNKLNKLLLNAGIVLAMGLTSSNAMAIGEVFTVNEVAITGTPTTTSFEATKINGEFSEIVTITSGNTFSTSLKLEFQGFTDERDDSTPSTFLGANETIDTINYGGYKMYLLYKSIGTFSATTSGFEYITTDAVFEMYADSQSDGIFTAPATGTPLLPALPSDLASIDYWSVSGAAGDDLMATGTFISGSATQTCAGTAQDNNCGSFGQTTTFALETLGENYFIDPVDFYTISIQSGNFNGFDPVVGSTQQIGGVPNVIFKAVPEPSVIALMGLGFMGLGFMRRSKQA